MRAALFCLLLMNLRAADAVDEMHLYYYERPPITYTENGQPAGDYIATLAPLLALAGITARYESVPAQRIFAELKANKTAFCSMGWFKTEARQQFAQFSTPYGSDIPLLVLTQHSQAAELERLGSLETLLQNRRRQLVFTQNFSAGEQLDKLIAKTKTPIEPQRLPDREALFARLLAEPLRYTLMRPQVFAYEARRRPELARKLTLMQFPDMPRTLPYYLMCSLRTDPGLLERLNREIRKRRPDLQGPIR